MTAVEGAIKAGLKASAAYKSALVVSGDRIEAVVRAAIASGYLVAADDTEGLRAALLRLGALEQIRWSYHVDPSTYDDCPKRRGLADANCSSCVPIYRFKGEQA